MGNREDLRNKKKYSWIIAAHYWVAGLKGKIRLEKVRGWLWIKGKKDKGWSCWGVWK